MRVNDFPDCCTMKILSRFGCDGQHQNRQVHSKEGIIKYINNFIDMVGNYYGMVVCTTNSRQKIAEEALRELGFSCSDSVKKDSHCSTKVRLWWLSLEGKKRMTSEERARKLANKKRGLNYSPQYSVGAPSGDDFDTKMAVAITTCIGVAVLIGMAIFAVNF